MWYHETDGGVIIQVKASAGSRSTEIVGVTGDFLKVKITTAPERGKANSALCEFLAKRLGVRASALHIVRGQTKPLKLVFVPLPVEAVEQLALT